MPHNADIGLFTEPSKLISLPFEIDSSMKILVAEDDIFTNRMLQKFLVDLGYDIIAAFDGHQAWKVFCQDEVHLVITDWMMPVMSGLDLVEKIRKRDETAYCYIILLTAKNGKDAIVEGISAGADDYIVKPFDKEELAVRVCWRGNCTVI